MITSETRDEAINRYRNTVFLQMIGINSHILRNYVVLTLSGEGINYDRNCNRQPTRKVVDVGA